MWKRRDKRTPISKAVGPPSREARTAAKWWADQLRKLARFLESRTQEDFRAAAVTKLDLIGAPIDYQMSRKALEALTDSNIKKFEESLAVAIQAELEKMAFSCYWSQRDKYHTDDLFRPHLEAANIPTCIGAIQPIFRHLMATVINPGKVVAHGDIIATNVVSDTSLPLVQ